MINPNRQAFNKHFGIAFLSHFTYLYLNHFWQHFWISFIPHMADPKFPAPDSDSNYEKYPCEPDEHDKNKLSCTPAFYCFTLLRKAVHFSKLTKLMVKFTAGILADLLDELDENKLKCTSASLYLAVPHKSLHISNLKPTWVLSSLASVVVDTLQFSSHLQYEDMPINYLGPLFSTFEIKHLLCSLVKSYHTFDSTAKSLSQVKWSNLKLVLLLHSNILKLL